MTTRQIHPLTRALLTLFGLLLVAGAFAGVLMLGTMTSKPTLRVAVALRDLTAGERLQPTDYRIVEQIIDPSLGRLYVQAQEVDEYHDNTVVDVIRRGDPLNKVKLANGDGIGTQRRYTLVLTNPNEVLMTLPVNPDLIPPKLTSGDTINVLFTAGDEAGTNRLPQDTSDAQMNGASTFATVATALPLPAPADPSQPTPTAAPTATPQVALPLADLMLQRVLVVDVTFQKIQNPNYGSGEGASADQPFIDGPITSIVVKVPREYQTLLGFGIASSKLRFTIASPNANDNRPELSMDWNTYLQFYHWKRAQVAMRGESVNNVVFPGYQPMTSTVTLQPQAAASAP